MIKNKKGNYTLIGIVIGLLIGILLVVFGGDNLKYKTIDTLNNNENEFNVDNQREYNIPILMYHTVKDDAENNTMNTKPSNFEKQIKYLNEQGYVTLTPFELQKIIYENKEVPEKAIMITFDDGYKDNYINAYPILKENEMQATIFVIASRILDEGEGLKKYPKEFEKITWQDIDVMRDYITIQSHTWDSHKKTDTDKKEGLLATRLENETEAQYKERIKEDLTKAQDVILERLGYPSVMIAYPYGEKNDTVIEVAQEVGLKIGVTVHKGTNERIRNPFNLERITIDGNYTGEDIVKLIEE